MARKIGPKRPSRRRTKRGPGSRPRPSPEDAEILDVEGAAKALGFSAKYIRQLAREGKLPATKFGNTWRFLRSDIRNTIAGGGQLGSIEKVLTRRGVKMGRKK